LRANFVISAPPCSGRAQTSNPHLGLNLAGHLSAEPQWRPLALDKERAVERCLLQTRGSFACFAAAAAAAAASCTLRGFGRPPAEQFARQTPSRLCALEASHSWGLQSGFGRPATSSLDSSFA